MQTPVQRQHDAVGRLFRRGDIRHHIGKVVLIGNRHDPRRDTRLMLDRFVIGVYAQRGNAGFVGTRGESLVQYRTVREYGDAHAITRDDDGTSCLRQIAPAADGLYAALLQAIA